VVSRSKSTLSHADKTRQQRKEIRKVLELGNTLTNGPLI
jgi:hypothetical protein